jgi:hypothetical protein
LGLLAVFNAVQSTALQGLNSCVSEPSPQKYGIFCVTLVNFVYEISTKPECSKVLLSFEDEAQTYDPKIKNQVKTKMFCTN